MATPRGGTLVASHITKSHGSALVLDDVSLTMRPGARIGVVGPNGIGKSTLLRILAGQLSPDPGDVRIAGADPAHDPFAVHRAVGWMPDFFGVYDDLTPREYLELFGAVYRLPRGDRRARADELLVRTGFQHLADVKVHTLSRGQKQRLGFARALVQRPRVLLLDEPASGLDPRARIDLRDLLREEAAGGSCVVVSSHILQELEEMVDVVVFVDRGRRTGTYEIEGLPTGTSGRRWRLRALNPDVLEAALGRAGIPVERTGGGGFVVEVADEEAAADLSARLVGEGGRLAAFAPDVSGLEEAFLTIGGEDR